MTVKHSELLIDTRGRGAGLYEITSRITEQISSHAIENGLANVFLRHTSCSLLIQENADPTAAYDLIRWFARLAPEDDPEYTHTLEGADDMPAHLRAAVTRTSEQIPVINGVLGLGTWQGLYLFEHRRRGALRKLWITLVF
ncbi:MAG: secondary thiamine-phosphate synthase enzyme YjbQ [Myxococcota bacterium]|nr:secondary thiamine-phosphate synthase enzyme YjbQ [Myxococcota bacterium]